MSYNCSIQVEKIVETYDNIINATAHDNLTMSMKRKYTGLTPYLLQSMCSGSEFGDNASLAKSNLSTLQSYKYDMADGGKQNISVECDDCEQNGMINLGDDLVSKYNSWECTQEYTCNGLFIFTRKRSYYVLKALLPDLKITFYRVSRIFIRFFLSSWL